MLSNAAQRTICRWTHIVCGFPMLGYIYGPPEEVAQYAPIFRYVFVPAVLVSGLWMWKGPAIRKLVTKKAE